MTHKHVATISGSTMQQQVDIFQALLELDDLQTAGLVEGRGEPEMKGNGRAASKRKVNEAANKSERRRWRSVKGKWPARSPEYRSFIRSQPCIVPGCDYRRHAYSGIIEAAHVGPIRGLSQKCSDFEVVPLCIWHHRLSFDSVHELQKGFWKHHNLDRDAIIAALNQAYAERKEAA